MVRTEILNPSFFERVFNWFQKLYSTEEDYTTKEINSIVTQSDNNIHIENADIIIPSMAPGMYSLKNVRFNNIIRPLDLPKGKIELTFERTELQQRLDLQQQNSRTCTANHMITQEYNLKVLQHLLSNKEMRAEAVKILAGKEETDNQDNIEKTNRFNLMDFEK